MRLLFVGGGNLAYYVARAALAKAHHVTLIVRDGAEAELLAQRTGALVVRGDGTLPDVQEDAGARRTDVLVALSPHDPDNLVSCQVAQRWFGVPRTVALVNDPDNRRLFEALGVKSVVSAAEILGGLIEHETGLAGILGALPLARGEASLMDVSLPEEAPAVGVALVDLPLPEDALVAGVIRGGRLLIPRGGLELKAGDELLLLSREDCADRALAALLGEEKA